MTIKYRVSALNTADARRVHGCDQAFAHQLVQALETSVPARMHEKEGLAVAVERDVLKGSGLHEEATLQNVLVFSCVGQPKFARVMLVFDLVGDVLDVYTVLYGKPSRNYRKSARGKFGAKEDQASDEVLFYMGVGSAAGEVMDEFMDFRGSESARPGTRVSPESSQAAPLP